MKVTLLDVWQALNVFARMSSLAGPVVTRPLSAIVIDSREAEPGSLFVALPGEHTDGHNFVAHTFVAAPWLPSSAARWTDPF